MKNILSILGVTSATLSVMYNLEPSRPLMYLAFMLFFLVVAVSVRLFRKPLGNTTGRTVYGTLSEMERRFDPDGVITHKVFLNVTGTFIAFSVALHDFAGPSALLKYAFILWVGLSVIIWWKLAKPAVEYQVFSTMVSLAAVACIQFVWVSVTRTMLFSMLTTAVFGWSSVHFIRKILKPVDTERIFSRFD